MAGIDLDKIKADLQSKGYTQADSRGDPRAWMMQQMGSFSSKPRQEEPKQEAVQEPASVSADEPACQEPDSPAEPVAQKLQDASVPDIFPEEDEEPEDEDSVPEDEPFGLDVPEDMQDVDTGPDTSALLEEEEINGTVSVQEETVQTQDMPKMDAAREPVRQEVVQASSVPEPEPVKETRSYQRPPETVQRTRKEPVKPKAKELKTRDGSPADVMGTVQVPNFPKALMTWIRNEIPNATNNADALAAWAYAKSDKSMVVPDAIKRLSASYKGEQDVRLLQRMDATLDHMSRMLNDMGRDHTNFELAVMYLVLERMNLVDDPTLEGFDVMIPNIEELRRMLHRQGSQVYRIDKDRKGRPIR